MHFLLRKEVVPQWHSVRWGNDIDMEFQNSPREMAEKLMEYIRDFSDDVEEVVDETNYVAELFDKLQKSEEFNALAHHLDIMFMNDNFSINEEHVMDDIKIDGIIFKHGEDDFRLCEGFYLSDEDENAILQILSKYETAGCSVRGTRKQIAEKMGGGQFTDDEMYILSDGVLALMKNMNSVLELMPESKSDAIVVLRESISTYKELNDKICMMIK